MEIEKEIECTRESIEIPWFFDYIRDNKEKFVDIFSYTEETFIIPGDILIENNTSGNGLVQNKKKFVDIFSYTEETFIIPGDILIENNTSGNGLVQNKKIYFKNYNVFDRWQNDPTLLLIQEENKKYNEENGIIMNFMRIKDLVTDIVFVSRSSDSNDPE